MVVPPPPREGAGGSGRPAPPSLLPPPPPPPFLLLSPRRSAPLLGGSSRLEVEASRPLLPLLLAGGRWSLLPLLPPRPVESWRGARGEGACVHAEQIAQASGPHHRPTGARTLAGSDGLASPPLLLVPSSLPPLPGHTMAARLRAAHKVDGGTIANDGAPIVRPSRR